MTTAPATLTARRDLAYVFVALAAKVFFALRPFPSLQRGAALAQKFGWHARRSVAEQMQSVSS